MTIKITTPNGGSDSLDFGCAQTPVVATVTGTEVSSGEGKLELKTTTSGTSATKVTVLANGDVGIGIAAPTSELQITAATPEVNIHDGAADTFTSGDVSSSLLFTARNSSVRTMGEIDAIHASTNGTIGHLRFQTRHGDALAERMRIDSSGKVGIGTTAPALPVEVECTARGIATSGTTPIGALRIGSPDNNIVLDTGITTGNYCYIQGTDKANLATGTNLLINPNGGNVGIGTAAPLAKNHTFGAGTAVVASGSDGRAEAIIEGANIPLTSSYGNLNIISNTSQAADTGGQIAFGGKHTDSNNAYGTWAVIKGAKENATSANIASYLAFSTRANGGGNTEKLRITSAGNVGIGTTAPEAKLDIRSDIDESSTYTGQLAINSVTKSTGNLARMMFSHDNHGSASIASDYESSGNGNLIFSTRGGGNPTERMRIAANGKVGIGISAAVYPLDVYGVIAIKDGESLTWKGNAQHSASIVGSGSAARVAIWTSQNERMRVTSTGKLLIGTTSEYSAPKVGIGYAGGSDNGIVLFSSTSSAASQISFFVSNTTHVGNITTNGSSSTSYNTSSDYRLKENVEYDWDATTRLKQLKPARFNFLADPDNTVDGFMAHEAQEVVPESVTGFKDEMADAVLYVKGDELPKGKKIGDIKEESKPVMQGIDQAKLVPLLVKTIQELEARIAKLEEDK